MKTILKTIPQQFKAGGYTLKLLKRSDAAAIYSVSNQEVIYAYETHKLRITPRRTCKFRHPSGGLKVIVQPKQERLSSSEDFGHHAWSFDSLKSAEKKFKELTEKGDKIENEKA